jgi:hypothetical protein
MACIYPWYLHQQYLASGKKDILYEYIMKSSCSLQSLMIMCTARYAFIDDSCEVATYVVVGMYISVWFPTRLPVFTSTSRFDKAPSTSHPRPKDFAQSEVRKEVRQP